MISLTHVGVIYGWVILRFGPQYFLLSLDVKMKFFVLGMIFFTINVDYPFDNISRCVKHFVESEVEMNTLLRFLWRIHVRILMQVIMIL